MAGVISHTKVLYQNLAGLRMLQQLGGLP